MFQTRLRTLALTVTLLTPPAWADEGFTNRDFNGDYAFHLDGVLSSSSGTPVVTAYDAAVGRFTADCRHDHKRHTIGKCQRRGFRRDVYLYLQHQSRWNGKDQL